MSITLIEDDEPQRGGHWVRLADDGRAHCRQCDWVSTATGAAAVDQGANHSAAVNE